MRAMCWAAGLVAICGAVACDDSTSSDSGAGGSGGTAGSGTGGAAGSGTGGSGTGGAAGSGTGGTGGAAGSGTGGSATGGTAGTGTGGTAGSGTGGTAGSGTGGAAGSGTGGTAGGSGITCTPYLGATICTAECAALPQTLGFGDTIQLGVKGSNVCFGTSPAVCRFTDNTYDDGPDACSNATRLFNFLYDSGTSTFSARAPSTYTVTSTSSGTINAQYAWTIDGIPASTATTVVFGDGSASYQIVFTWTATGVTVTSFAQL